MTGRAPWYNSGMKVMGIKTIFSLDLRPVTLDRTYACYRVLMEEAEARYVMSPRDEPPIILLNCQSIKQIPTSLLLYQ